jgi:hypothetical protein
LLQTPFRLRVDGPGGIPLEQQAAPFRFGQDGQCGDRPVGVGDDAFQKALEMGEQALDRAGLKQVGVVFDGGGQAIVHFRDGKGQIER